MEWIKIDPENLPKKEVLAANFKQGTYGYKEKLVGFIDITEDEVFCDSDRETLDNVTHYIVIDDIKL